jgi:hypothetical protein
MGRIDLKLRTGDLVDVKSASEIAETLDENGTLDSLPFMPEMLPYCGKRFRVVRRAEKTCVEMLPGAYKIREFLNNDVVLLENLRCDGERHDGCQRGCMLFWKTAWLRRAGEPEQTRRQEVASEKLAEGLKTMSASTYFCQSTELARTTHPISRPKILLKCFEEVRSGSRSAPEMFWLIVAPLFRKITARIPRRRLAGDLKRTPVGTIDLGPGELVVIKPAEEIALTLDHRGRNRGLSCDFGMTQYSGGRYRVRNRLDRMISEPTGEMRNLEGTVILEGLHCLCWNVLGGCPRQDFMYWRELWLRRPEGTENGCGVSREYRSKSPFKMSAQQSSPADGPQ